jgi:L-aspartate oxidase
MTYDIIIIGTGIAGLYTALKLDKKYKILMISKGKLSNCNTLRAEGGMACAISKDDSPLLHAKDTYKAGGALNDYKAVETLTEEVLTRIKDLEAMGFVFDHHADGSLILGLEGCHSKRRILHSFSDRIGVSIFQFLSEKAKEQSNIEFLEDTSVTEILLNDQQEFCGVITVKEEASDTLYANNLLLASGGYSNVFARSTSDPSILGDLLPIAYRAGLMLTDLEFVQFHPTTFIKQGYEPFLLSEALRGEGAILLNHNRERFMMQYHPEQELASRDIVSRAIYDESRKQGDEVFFLDLKPIGKDKLNYLFPGIRDACAKRGVDIFTELVPIFPAAHYTMGGVRTNLCGETNIRNIFAVGEVACNGVHGANRLASNSLIDALVFAFKTADMIMSRILKQPCANPKPFSTEHFDDQYPEILDIKQRNWDNMGIERNGNDLSAYASYLEPYYQKTLANSNPLEANRNKQNIVLLSYLICQVANLRKESRGAHFRLDYPVMDPMFQFSYVLKKKTGSSTIDITFDKRGVKHGS